jgi:glycosyltransferase involved in cell wall biosynthesis
VPRSVSERIALVAPSLEAAAVLRHDLIAWLADRGHRVLCLTPPGPAKYARILRGLGAMHRNIELQNTPLRMFDDWQTTKALVEQFKDWQPNIAVAFGLRTMTLASIAARRADVPRVVSLVNGLPNDGVDGVGRRRFALAARLNDALVFHNRENAATLARQGVLPPGVPTLVVPGSGIDLVRFPAAPLPDVDHGVRFLMLARLERRRGVTEYKAAAERLKGHWPDAAFQFAGPASASPDALSPEELTDEGVVEYLGPLDDVRQALGACHVFVYPSHWEGMPRAVLEALATGRPVITTRTPGCKDAIDETVNGCLVPPGDAAALADAMETYLKHPGLIASGARAARLKAERRFDARDVNAKIAALLGVA